MTKFTLYIITVFMVLSLLPSSLKADPESGLSGSVSGSESTRLTSLAALQGEALREINTFGDWTPYVIRPSIYSLNWENYIVTNLYSPNNKEPQLVKDANQPPTPSVITATGSVTFCIGDSVRLSGNIGGTWNTGDTTGAIIVKTSGDFYVVNTDTSGSIESNHIVVKVVLFPIASILTSNDTTSFCAGDSVVIIGNVGGFWSTGGMTTSITVKSSGDYFVTNSNSCDTLISNHIVVTVSPGPVASVITANKSTTFCMGDSVTLTGNVGGIWNTGDTTSSIKVKTSGEFFVNNGNNCDTVSSNHVVVKVELPPIASILISNDTTAFCAGDSVVITGNVGGVWSTGDTTTSITVKSSGDYFVTNSNSCDTLISNHIIVNVRPLPVASVIAASTATTFCMGDSVTLTGNSGGRWNTGDTTASIKVKASGDYFVNNGNNCDTVSSNHIIVKVELPLIASILVGNDTTTFCAGDSVVITGNVGGVWSTGDTTSSITVKSSGDYFVTNSNSCDTVSSNHIVVKVNLFPIASILVSHDTTAFCAGDSVVITGNVKGIWSTGDTTSSITVKSSGDYFVTNSNSCDTLISNHIIVNVRPLPVASVIAASTATTFCMGDSVTLTGNSGGRWNTGDTTASITVKSSGDYFVSNSNICDTVTSNHIIIKVEIPNIPIAITSGGSTNICVGDSLKLSGNIGGVWNTGDTSAFIMVKSSGDYFVTRVNSCDSITSNHMVVTVNPLPDLSTIVNDTICQGQILSLGTLSIAGHTYKWSTKSGALISSIANPLLSPLANSIYILKQTITATGCHATKTVAITVGTNPSCAIGGNNIICEGQSTQLCAPSGAFTYLWSNGDTTRCITVDSIARYTVVVTNSLGCSSKCGRDVLRGEGPCDIVGNGFIYGGQTTEFCAPKGYASYKWSNGATTRCITVSAAGTYGLTVTNTNSCNSTCSKTLTVTPTVSCEITGDTVICPGSSATLCANSFAGNTYSWSTGATTRCIDINCEGTFSVRVTNNGAYSICGIIVENSVETPSQTATITISGNLNPNQGDSTTLCAPMGYHSYLWSTGATTRCIKVGSSGNYTVNVQNVAGGCTYNSEAFVSYPALRRTTPVINNPIAPLIANTSFEIKAYPNPFNSVVNFEFQTDQLNSHIKVELTGLAGNKIATIFDNDVVKGIIYKARLDGSQLAEGVYLYRIINGDQIISKKLILIR